MEKNHFVQRSGGRKVQRILFVLFLPLILSSFVLAAEIPLTWDPSANVVSGY